MRSEDRPQGLSLTWYKLVEILARISLLMGYYEALGGPKREIIAQVLTAF